MWKQVSCPYILKFNGIFYRNGVPVILTPWMSHGNITEYLENHPEVDRLRLVSSNAPPGPALIHFAFHHCIAFRCGQRSQVPPQLQYSAWGYQSSKLSNSYERSGCEIIVFLAKHPHHGLHSTPSRPCRLWFHTRNDRFGEDVERRARCSVLHGSRAPLLGQILSEERGSIQRGGYIRFGDDGISGVNG